MKLNSPSFRNHRIDLNFGKFASPDYLINDLPRVSFQIEWTLEQDKSNYIHLIYIDYDAINASSKPFVHWSVANLNKSEYSTGLKENASFLLKDEINQGVNSLLGADIKDQKNWTNANWFLGSMPPNCLHTYTLIVFTTQRPISLSNPFTVDKLFRVLLEDTTVVEKAILEGDYPSHL